MLSNLMVCWAYLDHRGEFGDFSSDKLLYLSHSTLFITRLSHLDLGCYQASCHEVGSGLGVLGELLGGGLGLVGHGALPQVIPSLRLQGSLTDPLAMRLAVRVALRLRLVIFTIWGSFRLDGCAVPVNE